MNIQEEFWKVVGVLQAAGVEHALCGGLAVAVHGAPRATRDIDLLVREDDVPRALEAVAALGYTFRANPMTFPDGMRLQRVSRIQGRDLMTIDLLLVGPETEAAWASRRSLETSEGSVSVVSREELVAMKIWAGRAQDLADVERLNGDDR